MRFLVFMLCLCAMVWTVTGCSFFSGANTNQQKELPDDGGGDDSSALPQIQRIG